MHPAARLGVNKERFLTLSSQYGDTSGTLSLLGTWKGKVFTRGKKFFELSNHLGNVLVTITDRKKQVPKNDTLLKYYEPDVATANDYYPFGMLQPGRKYSAAGTGYRYGFNGKENDNEVKGEGNQQDYGMRIYDPRLGKFLSVDPISNEYPWNSPYSFAECDPINYVDLDGLERGGSPAQAGPVGSGGGRGTTTPYRNRGSGDPASSPRGPRTPGGQTGQQAGELLREGHRIFEERENAKEIAREIRLGIRDEIVARSTKLGNMASNYLARVWTSAQYTFAGGQTAIGGQVLINKANSKIFENEVYNVMIKNPDYKTVVQQVTFVVKSNNGNSVRIRVDNVGMTHDGKIDFAEAKFSIYEITLNSVNSTLTINQKDFFSMVINNDIASIKFVGGRDKVSQMELSSGTEVSGIIRDIKIYTPLNPLKGTSSNNNGNAGTTTTGNNNTSANNSNEKSNSNLTTQQTHR